MQPRPALPVDDVIIINSSNKSQQRGPHGAFRYFGKLAPDVTGRVLDLAAEHAQLTGPVRVVDLMCGSGTTLIEASDRGWSSIGVDVNPVACLYATAKTRSVDANRYLIALDEVLQQLNATSAEADAVFAQTRNAERWFTVEARHTIAALRRNIMALPESPEARLLFAVLLSRLRRMSNASAKTGRIFFDPESAVPAADDFAGAAKLALDSVPDHDLDARVVQSDARATELPSESAEIVFLHPPYFALYRFSSDVLRFEMEIGGFSRGETAKKEVREGWKSGDPNNLAGHVEDMRLVLVEGRRLLRPGGVLALTASNSTLGDHELPVIDELAAAGGASGFTLNRHYERAAHHGSASYHKSARSDKVIQQDHVLLFTAI
jgi:site-specific DNA-methyltransferase (cytosine-N4-specific)